MAALPSLPFRVGMDLYNWVEDKLERMNFPSMKHLYKRAVEFCIDHPFVGIFLALTTIINLGPLTLLAVFLLCTSTCLLIGFALAEFFILIAGMSVFIPAFLIGVIFSVTLTSSVVIMSKIWMGIYQKRNKLTKNKYSTPSGFMSASMTKYPKNKMTQTTEWIENTGQNGERNWGQIEQISFSKLTDDELINTEDSAGRIELDSH